MAIKINIIVKNLIILIVLFLVQGCNTTYFKDNYEFYKGQTATVTSVPSNAFNLCTTFFVNKAVVYSKAEMYCARQNKKPKLITKSYFTDCSLISPIVYVFACE